MYEWRRQIQQIVDEIDGCIRSHDDAALTLRSLSRTLGYSEYYTTRKFREISGMQLRDYLRRRRLAFALREVREETGLTMHTPVYRGIVDFYCDPWPAERMHLYTCTDFYGEMTDCDEGCLEWVDKAAVQDLPIWQGDKIFLRLLAEGAPFFHLELTYHGDTLVQAVLEGETLPCG